ncbi:hypothetical protein NX059_006016 [Plenodomus lindquistii]|nr:hypothetical protein NX059_006016 [Plenodomus lindquistii]
MEGRPVAFRPAELSRYIHTYDSLPTFSNHFPYNNTSRFNNHFNNSANMRFQATIVAFAASLALTGAQDLSAVPQCALPCLLQAIPSSGCSATDITCQCTTGQAALTESLLGCVPNACSAEDQARLTPALLAVCQSAGISVSAPASAAASAVSSAVQSAQSGLSSAIASVASSASAAASSAASAASSAASGMASATGSAPPQVSTAAAAANFAGLGAVAMGLAAFAL